MSEHDPYGALRDRTAENYERRESERFLPRFFKLNPSVPLWIADKGEHRLNILPYLSGPYDPKVSEGQPTYVLDVYVSSL